MPSHTLHCAVNYLSLGEQIHGHCNLDLTSSFFPPLPISSKAKVTIIIEEDLCTAQKDACDSIIVGGR